MAACQQANAQTAAEISQVGELGDMALGSKDAPVTIIEYASMTCPHCAAFTKDVFPQIKTNYIDTGKVRFIFREFPLGSGGARGLGAGPLRRQGRCT